MIAPDIILSDFHATCKKQIFKKLAHIAADLCNIPHEELFQALVEREKIGCTGIGQGVAIPHIRMQDIPRIAGIFITLKEPVHFESYDDRPVDLVYLLLAPQENHGNTHLQALSRVSHMFRDAEFCAEMRRLNQHGQGEVSRLFRAA